MTFNEAESIQMRIDVLKRRKALLEIQQARKGYITDPSVQMEIEDIEKDIQHLQGQLNVIAVDSSIPKEQRLMVQNEILPNLIEKIEYLNQEIQTLVTYCSGKHVSSNPKVAHLSIVTDSTRRDEELKMMIDSVNSRIESFTSFYRQHKIQIPEHIDTLVSRYQKLILRRHLSVENLVGFLIMVGGITDDSWKPKSYERLQEDITASVRKYIEMNKT